MTVTPVGLEPTTNGLKRCLTLSPLLYQLSYEVGFTEDYTTGKPSCKSQLEF